jgi:2,4-dichlorophenol 6-monooxygenase
VRRVQTHGHQQGLHLTLKVAVHPTALFGIALTVHLIGPRCEWQDYSGDWARAREITDSGALLVRPDQHVAWRAGQVSADAAGQLRAAMLAILGK